MIIVNIFGKLENTSSSCHNANKAFCFTNAYTPLAFRAILTLCFDDINTLSYLAALNFSFFGNSISFLGKGGGGGKAKSLKKIYLPRAIFKLFDPPWLKVLLKEHQSADCSRLQTCTSQRDCIATSRKNSFDSYRRA